MISNVDSDYFLFADDSLLFQEVSSHILTVCTLNNQLNAIHSWSNKWLVTLNT